MVVAKGFCDKHYRNFVRHGDPLAGRLMVMHGMSRKRLYNIWKGMIRRCGHKPGANAGDRKNYLERGIRVCPAWHDLTAFVKWAESNGYADDLSIDRIDSDRGYAPDNCRWITMRENLRARKDRKVNPEMARQIRRLRKAGTAVATMADRYGLSEGHVYRVIADDRWAE